jgi:hypothetical protein
MKRCGQIVTGAFALALIPFGLGGCGGGDHFFEETDVVGRVLLAGNPVDGAFVQIIFAGFIQDTETTAPDGTFVFDDFPEDFEPFFVEAFYIDPVTLNEYEGVTPFFGTNNSGDTDVGDIVLVQTFPVTAPGANNAKGHLDDDPIEDLAAASPAALVVMLSSGASRVVATADDEHGVFGAVAIQDLDGDGRMDLVVNRLGSGRVDAFLGDGKGGFAKH